LRESALLAWLGEALDINNMNQTANVFWPISHHPSGEALDLTVSACGILLDPIALHERIVGQGGKNPKQFLSVPLFR